MNCTLDMIRLQLLHRQPGNIKRLIRFILWMGSARFMRWAHSWFIFVFAMDKILFISRKTPRLAARCMGRVLAFHAVGEDLLISW